MVPDFTIHLFDFRTLGDEDEVLFVPADSDHGLRKCQIYGS